MLKIEDKIFMERLQCPLINKALNTIKFHTPKEISFHTLEHTLDVIREIILFSVDDGLNDREFELLTIAGAYHDIGYTRQLYRNEGISARMAAEAMSAASYSNKEIQSVVSMIEDTKIRITNKGLKQVCRSKLAGYLLDADLSNFGRPDFLEKRHLVFHDLKLSNWKVFLIESLQFIEDHCWKTKAAQNLRETQKNININQLKYMIASLK